jgi:prepilin signal peptidase PulO-like enzyme (type II secretory pathway)
MDIFPQYVFFIFFAVLGLIIGSFLDVVLTRFNTGASLQGRSRCLSCGHTLSWYELMPLLSYVVLRGRCFNCGSHIPLRLLTTELLTASLFVWSYVTFGMSIFLAPALVLVALLVLITLYDYDHMVIPHFFVYALLGVGFLYMCMEYAQFGNSFTPVFHFASALGASSFFGLLWFFSKGRWIGLGDAKLAFALGLFLSPIEAFSFVVFSFWIGAGVSLLVLLCMRILHSGQKHLRFYSLPLTMKSEVPFAPFLVASFLIVFLGHATLFSLLKQIYGVSF